MNTPKLETTKWTIWGNNTRNTETNTREIGRLPVGIYDYQEKELIVCKVTKFPLLHSLLNSGKGCNFVNVFSFRQRGAINQSTNQPTIRSIKRSLVSRMNHFHLFHFIRGSFQQNSKVFKIVEAAVVARPDCQFVVTHVIQS